MKYILKFTPTDKYFFGSENRSPGHDRHDKNKDIANYFLKSFTMPQQSTILGALRYFFLKFIVPTEVFAEGKIKKKEEAAKIIGYTSFHLDGVDFKFGKIESVSEVFLVKDADIYLPLPFDKWAGSFGEVTDIGNTGYYFLPGYDAKQNYEMHFTNGTTNVKQSCIFDEVVQTGNTKNNKGDDDDKAFYKIQYFNLKQGWSFAVEIETEVSLNLLKHPLYMPIGGGNKLFKIDILENLIVDRQAILKYCANPYLYKVVLTSDAYFGLNSPYGQSAVAFTRTRPFRYLSSYVNNTDRYNNRAFYGNSLEQSHLYEIIEKGSVFFFTSLSAIQEFTGKTIKNGYLQKAGFNQCTIVNPVGK